MRLRHLGSQHDLKRSISAHVILAGHRHHARRPQTKLQAGVWYPQTENATCKRWLALVVREIAERNSKRVVAFGVCRRGRGACAKFYSDGGSIEIFPPHLVVMYCIAQQSSVSSSSLFLQTSKVVVASE